jgi:uncharacterized protein YfaS (alpha-2-macroglobulin family)
MRICTALSAISLLAFGGCTTLAGVPDLSTDLEDPLVLTPGETRIVTVNVTDRHGIVARVVGTVADGETEKHLTLFDDGVTESEGFRADEQAGDGIWSARVSVPLNFIEGETQVRFAAFRENGLPVEVRRDDVVVPLEIPLTIQVRLPAE